MMKGKKSSCQTGEKPLTELDQIKPVTGLGKFSQYTVWLPHSQGQMSNLVKIGQNQLQAKLV